MTESRYTHTVQDPAEPNVQITRDVIRIGDANLPTQFVEADSVIVSPGDVDNCNRVTLTLFVADIDIDADCVEDVREHRLGVISNPGHAEARH